MPARQRQGPLEGQRFVFTGELQQYTREEAARRVEQLGGVATEAVSDHVDYVVVGRDPGRKLSQAKKKKNVQTIKENAFQKLVGSRSGG